MKRIVPTPRGMAELDIAGSERQAFVNVTLFGEDGWATDEDMWWSRQGEGLAQHLAGLTGMPPSAADAVVGDFMDTWRRRGGPAEGAAMTHRFSYGLLGVLLSVAGLTGLVAWFVGRNSPKGRLTLHSQG